MYTTSEPLFNSLCRTCMDELAEKSTFEANTKPQQQGQSIFDTIEECGALRIAEVLSKTIPQIEVQQGDALPQKICCECLKSLLSAYRYQQLCLQSQQHMREMIAKRNDDLIKIEPSQDEFIKQELLPEPDTKVLEVISEFVNSLPEAEPSSAADPLQNIGIDEAIKHFVKSQYELEELVSNALCADKESNAEDSNEEFVMNEQRNDDKPFDEAIKHFVKSQYELEELVSNALCADKESNAEGSNEEFVMNEQRNDDKPCAEHSDDETMHSIATIKNEVLTVEERMQVNLKDGIEKLQDEQKAMNVQHFEDTEPTRVSNEQTNTQMSKYVCDLCNLSLCSRFSLKRHKNLRHDTKRTQNPINIFKKPNKRHPCDLCDKTCCSLFSLARHKKAWHTTKGENPQKKLNACDICDKAYKTPSELTTHIMYAHTEERPYLCPECGKSFKIAGSLNEHRRRHTDYRPYECPYCPLKFRCVSDLGKHRVTHQASKPHICDICGARFKKPYMLTRHKNRHSGVKPYKCEYCEMRFFTESDRAIHARTHTGEKPYKCQYCHRAFAQSGDVIKHLRIHVGDDVYRCEFCPLAFPLRSQLRLHLTTHKNEDPETRERNMTALKEEIANFQIKQPQRKRM